ncbi:10534_t:CDS:2 [Rhizophagus irregularis]|nr:10534_t:CDS:2 [Rhizophagus irregularis]
MRNKLGDLVFGISLINYTSEFAEAVQEKFSKFKNIEIPKAINYELPVLFLESADFLDVIFQALGHTEIWNGITSEP